MATETWVINEYPTLSKNKHFNVNFISNEILFSTISFGGAAGGIPMRYDEELVYAAGDQFWRSQAYRTIILNEPATGDFLTWLQANAVKQEVVVYKQVDSTKLNSDLTSVATAIRSKSGGSSLLSFPSEYNVAIDNLETSELVSGTISDVSKAIYMEGNALQTATSFPASINVNKNSTIVLEYPMSPFTVEASGITVQQIGEAADMRGIGYYMSNGFSIAKYTPPAPTTKKYTLNNITYTSYTQNYNFSSTLFDECYCTKGGYTVVSEGKDGNQKGGFYWSGLATSGYDDGLQMRHQRIAGGAVNVYNKESFSVLTNRIKTQGWSIADDSHGSGYLHLTYVSSTVSQFVFNAEYWE